MPARLFCKTGELDGAEHAIDREATIGRLSQNEITLYPAIISGRHARIFFDDAEACYFLEDLGSSNGTALDGMAVHEPTRLGTLHVITFANQLDFIFQALPQQAGRRAVPPARRRESAPREERPARPPLEETLASTDVDSADKTQLGGAFAPLPDLSAEPTVTESGETQRGDPFEASPFPEEPEDPGEKTRLGDDFFPLPSLSEKPPPGDDTRLDVAPLEEAAGLGDDTVWMDQPLLAPASFTLDVKLPDGTRAPFTLKPGENVVGRDSDCDVPLKDSSVSRRHALITVRADRVTLQDLGSKNATYVEGRRLSSEVEVTPDTAIRFGLEIEARLRRE